jgi:hypothetical protein
MTVQPEDHVRPEDQRTTENILPTHLCQICGSRFDQESALDAHRAAHEGPKLPRTAPREQSADR